LRRAGAFLVAGLVEVVAPSGRGQGGGAGGVVAVLRLLGVGQLGVVGERLGVKAGRGGVELLEGLLAQPGQGGPDRPV
jgi:hypothetical protein